jgi:hypothetical protein
MSTTDPATGAHPNLDGPAPTDDPTDPPAQQVSRDAAVRALAIALEHRNAGMAPAELERLASQVVDAHLTVGPRPWAILIENDPECEYRLAAAVIAVDAGQLQRPPTAQHLRGARTVIKSLIHGQR